MTMLAICENSVDFLLEGLNTKWKTVSSKKVATFWYNVLCMFKKKFVQISNLRQHPLLHPHKRPLRIFDPSLAPYSAAHVEPLQKTSYYFSMKVALLVIAFSNLTSFWSWEIFLMTPVIVLVIQTISPHRCHHSLSRKNSPFIKYTWEYYQSHLSFDICYADPCLSIHVHIKWMILLLNPKAHYSKNLTVMYLWP